MPRNSLIQIRKGSAVEWTGLNPVLASGEPGIDLTNNHLKVGDGISPWISLEPIGKTLNSGVYDIYTNINSNYVASIDDHIIFVDSSDNLVNIIIPTANGIGGKKYIIKKIGGNNDITVNSSIDGETIDGNSTLLIRYVYESVSLISNNSNWFIV